MISETDASKASYSSSRLTTMTRQLARKLVEISYMSVGTLPKAAARKEHTPAKQLWHVVFCMAIVPTLRQP